MGMHGGVKVRYMALVIISGSAIAVLGAFLSRYVAEPKNPETITTIPMVQGISDEITKKNSSKKSSKKPSSSQTTNKSAVKKLPSIPKDTAMGIYTGPGKITAHDNFAQWLGADIPYTTDYIDYKGGWEKDFVDSKVWLTKPWGSWVNDKPGQRLVLGVPMLQNQNYGEFSRGVDGDFDKYFRGLAEELVANELGDSIIRLGYEANCDTIGPWQATRNPKGYRKLFRHQVAVMKSVPGAKFKFDWTVCNGLQGGRALTSFDSFYPGDDVVDIIGMDIYDVKWRDPKASAEERWRRLRQRTMGIEDLLSFAKKHKKPVSYPEWGLYRPGDNFSGGGDNPYFIEKMAKLIHTTKPRYQSYFNIDWGGGVLSDFPKGEKTFKQIFGKR